MTPAVEQLVRETIELTGAAAPELLERDAPVLSADALAGGDGSGDGADGGGGFYLVGIIGGKDVGKSALVNALVGRAITAITSHGPGTEVAVAYAHQLQEPALRALLEREVPGQYRIVTHDSAHLLRQVLLDLPDIDSHWEAHLRVTRAMLRHMLYPVWVQSVEKYADRQPQEMLARVAAGNAAQNFVFCLNKVDQLDGAGGGIGANEGTGGPSPAEEVREDFAGRIARTLGLAKRPDVHMISAIRPERFDLPRLRALLSQQRAAEAVRESKQLAVRRQDSSLVAWLGEQRLAERAERLARLQAEAEERLAARVGGPLLEEAVPRILDDPANRLALTDEVMRARVARWPLVNLVHTLLSPLLAVWRSNVGAGGRAGLRGADALVDAYVGAAGGGTALSTRVQSTFAQLRQAQPAVADLYRHNRLWEDMPAEAAADDLRRTLAAVVDRQRLYARTKLAGRGGLIAPLFRWLATIGALLWFPFLQPILQGLLAVPNLDLNFRDWQELARLFVGVVSGASLLQNGTFLAMWYTLIYLALRWNTQRRVARLLDRWKSADHPDATLNLTAAALGWINALLAPVKQGHDRTAELARRAEDLARSTSVAA